MALIKIKNRAASLLIVLFIYIIAVIIGILVFNLFGKLHIITATLIADIAATIFVWLTGLLLENASVYDPYWSVAPIIIFVLWINAKGAAFSAAEILLVIAFAVWGARLTLNWILRWRGLQHQDWRYTMLRDKNPKMYFFTNLFGINLIPTLFVFVALVPAYFSIGTGRNINALTIIGFLICLGAAVIQFVSDMQMDSFRKNSDYKSRLIEKGMWKYSRHPNYFGEVSLWWGVWIIQVSIAPGTWITVLGPIMMTLLFMFISIPMMEKYISESRPYYSDYSKRVSMLVPWFRKK